jgi:DNA-binding transcriptional ArsR family regulator
MRVMDFTGRSTVTTEIELSLPAELLNTAFAYTWTEARDTLEVDPSWFDEIRTAASPELLALLKRDVFGAGKVWGSLVSLALRPPAAQDVEALIQRVEEQPPLELRLLILGYRAPSMRASHGPLIERAARGDAQAMERLLADESYSTGRMADALRRMVSIHPEEDKSSILEALRRWGREVFAARADEARAVLARDVEAKRRLARTMPMEDLIERATNGLEYAPQPGVRRVLLVPHIALRPWNILDDDGDTYIINYPVADESLRPDRSAPPARLLRLYRALDDDKRLRILRRLAGSSASLQELAEAAGVAKSTAHHHLVILRSAGLVRTTLEPKGRYSIRPETVGQSSGWLEAFLEGRDG